MNSVTAFLLENWLAVLCLLAALGLGVAAAIQHRRQGSWSWRLYLPALLLSSYGIGAFDFLPAGGTVPVGPLISLAGFAGLVLMFVLLILMGGWNAVAAYGLAMVCVFGLGAVTGPAATSGLNDAGQFLFSLRASEPGWLLLLLFIPVLFWTSFKNLVTLGPTRRWIAIGLRCSLIVFLACALAEVHARKPSDNTTVLFLWDRSFGVPPKVQAAGVDLREQWQYSFINDAVAKRGGAHGTDLAGVIVFGKQPKLELPPASVPRLGFKKVVSQFDRSYTDIAAAIKLALASFPEGAGKRIVLISDGNENIGNAEEQARIAKQNGVQIDVVPIASSRQHQNEILIDRLEAPPVTEKDSRLPIRVVVHSFHPQVVRARLTLRKMTFDPGAKGTVNNGDTVLSSTIVNLRQGLQTFHFQPPGTKEDTVHAYEATVVPIEVVTPEGALVQKGLPGDRVDNNTARACVIARGERAILLLEPNLGDHRLLADRLRAAKSSLKVVSMTPERMRQLTKGDAEMLATFLSRFDAVIFANVPAESIADEEQKAFRSAVHDQGAGFIMIGGNQSFGAGGWQNTEIEKVLPVAMELKAMKVEGKSGLVLMMHASEISEGNAWQRKIARLAIEKLSPMDMVGQLHYNGGWAEGATGHKWHIPFQEIGGNKNRILRLADSMEPGDMPDVDPAFEKAYKELTNPEYKLGTKHIIFISDGDHWNAGQNVLARLRAAKITVTTVCITSHGQDEVKKMAAVARFTGGRSYYITDPKELPRIYVKESRLVSQSFVHEGKFGPRLITRVGPTEGIPEALPPLYGFVRTTLKDSSLVQSLIETPKIGQYKFPILAAWQFGLGRSVAFTSDARTLAKGSVFWDRDWANSDIYAKFWEQAVDWVLRPTETGRHLYMTTEQKDGKIRVIVEAQDLDKTPLTDVVLKAGITSPTFKQKDDRRAELKFEQKNSGVYVAEFPSDEVGAYFINIQAKWKKDGQEVQDNVRAGVTIPYSPEFAEMESNPGLVEKLAQMTGGKVYRDDPAVLEDAAQSGEVFRKVPRSHASLQTLWPWLVFLTALCLLLDVAIRRIAIQPEAVAAKVSAQWERLRGRQTAEDSMPVFIERLKSRKAQVEETMEKKKAARKFEATGTTSAAAPTIVPIASADQPAPRPVKKAPAQNPEDADDFATRLMRAKRKAMEDRDKDKPT